MYDKRKLQTVLRKGERKFVTRHLVGRIFNLKKKEAEKLLHDLERSGYIEPIGVEGCWGLAMRGKVLASQTFERSFTAQTMQAHLNACLKRVALINAYKDHFNFVSKIKVTSEYPIQNKGAGVRITYSLRRKKEPDEFSKLFMSMNPHFNEPFKLISHPDIILYKALKSRSRVLKITYVEDEEMENVNGTLIFDLAAGRKRSSNKKA